MRWRKTDASPEQPPTRAASTRWPTLRAHGSWTAPTSSRRTSGRGGERERIGLDPVRNKSGPNHLYEGVSTRPHSRSHHAILVVLLLGLAACGAEDALRDALVPSLTPHERYAK